MTTQLCQRENLSNPSAPNLKFTIQCQIRIGKLIFNENAHRQIGSVYDLVEVMDNLFETSDFLLLQTINIFDILPQWLQSLLNIVFNPKL